MGKKGQLLFKGDKRPKKKSKRTKSEKGIRGEKESGHAAATLDALQAQTTTAPQASSSSSSFSSTPTIQTGTGRISSSGTVVTGHDTKFEREISIGDAILVTIGNNNKNTKSDRPSEEMRVVTMRLSNASLNLSSAFSENLREPASFRYVRKPRNLEQEQQKKKNKQLEEANAVEKNAFDIYGKAAKMGANNSGNVNVFTYREKTETGSYRVKQQEVTSESQASTRGGLLALRSKKSSDKYC